MRIAWGLQSQVVSAPAQAPDCSHERSHWTRSGCDRRGPDREPTLPSGKTATARQAIIAGILQPYAKKPGAALSILKMLRVLIRHAIEIGWLKHDPSFGIKRPKTNEIRSWTDAEIAVFEKHWPIGTKQRLGFALMLYTGQRRSDVHRMTWTDVNEGTIRVAQQKTGRKLTIPLPRPPHGVDRRHGRRHDPQHRIWQAVHS